ncbi:MAG TPA: T9SS type A sorting domain-containing protein [Candidatus Kapabacteria bacterium]|nr:T9SS type A sorting domain-containing protein [Candidatus Kapabacteria bacterium]
MKNINFVNINSKGTKSRLLLVHSFFKFIYIFTLIFIVVIDKPIIAQGLIETQSIYLKQTDRGALETVMPLGLYHNEGSDFLYMEIFEYVAKPTSADIDSTYPYIIKYDMKNNNVVWKKVIKGNYYLSEPKIYLNKDDEVVMSVKACMRGTQPMQVYLHDCAPTIIRLDKDGNVKSMVTDTNSIKVDGMYDSGFNLKGDKIMFWKLDSATNNLRYLLDSTDFTVTKCDSVYVVDELGTTYFYINDISISENTDLLSISYVKKQKVHYEVHQMNLNTGKASEFYMEGFDNNFAVFCYDSSNNNLLLRHGYSRTALFNTNSMKVTNMFQFKDGEKQLYIKDAIFINDNICCFFVYDRFSKFVNGKEGLNSLIFTSLDGTVLKKIDSVAFDWDVTPLLQHSNNKLYLVYKSYEEMQDNNKEKLKTQDSLYIAIYDINDLVSVESFDRSYNLEVVPNIVNDLLYIRNINSEMLSTNDNIQIYNILGILNKTLPLPIDAINNHNSNINVNDLSPGVYFIKIANKIAKFIKI